MKSNYLFILYLLFFNQLNSQISFTTATSACKNDTINLTALTGTLSNTTYTWAANPNGAIFSAPNNSITSVTFTNATTYTIILSATSGTNISVYQNTITVFALPIITLSQNTNTTCITSNNPLYSLPVHLSAIGGVSYTWNPAPAPNMIGGNPNGPTNDVRPSVNSCFSLTGIDANGCKAMTSICVTVMPRFSINVTPSTTTICKNNFSNPGYTAELIAGNPTAPAFGLTSTHNYSWTDAQAGSILTTLFSPTIVCAPQINSTYTVQMFDSLNCVSLPAMTTVSVQNCTEITENASFNAHLKIFPNPFKDKLHVDVQDEKEIDRIAIINLLGQEIISKRMPSSKVEFDTSELTKGVYFLQLKSGSELKTLKIIKE